MTSPTEQVRVVPMERLRRLNAESGGHWFDADTLRFFSSRVAQHAYAVGALAWFVSSECPPRGERRWSVRVADLSTGRVHTAGEFLEYGSRSGADKAARRMAERALAEVI